MLHSIERTVAKSPRTQLRPQVVVAYCRVYFGACSVFDLFRERRSMAGNICSRPRAWLHPEMYARLDANRFWLCWERCVGEVNNFATDRLFLKTYGVLCSCFMLSRSTRAPARIFSLLRQSRKLILPLQFGLICSLWTSTF